MIDLRQMDALIVKHVVGLPVRRSQAEAWDYEYLPEHEESHWVSLPYPTTRVEDAKNAAKRLRELGHIVETTHTGIEFHTVVTQDGEVLGQEGAATEALSISLTLLKACGITQSGLVSTGL